MNADVIFPSAPKLGLQSGIFSSDILINNWLQGAKSFLWRRQSSDGVKFSSFMGPKGSLSRSQESAAGP
jgi:hypothetical protein